MRGRGPIHSSVRITLNFALNEITAIGCITRMKRFEAELKMIRIKLIFLVHNAVMLNAVMPTKLCNRNTKNNTFHYDQ